MALINGWYVQVVDESVSNETDITSHAVETGIDISDHIRNKPVQISISGNIVDVGDVKAYTILSQLQQFQKSGAMIEYHGRNVQNGLMIASFNTTHPNTINGGCEFSMELRGLRTAAPSYIEEEEVAEVANVPDPVENPVLEIGATVVFCGGPVYLSSDAQAAAATKSRSTCVITHISKAIFSIHQYHLESTDGGNVYGWVDVENIEGVEGNTVHPTRVIGVQQIVQGDNKNIYHLVKLGDQLYDLVNVQYKDLNTTAEWVMEHNPEAFAVQGDPTSLKADYSILMGVRA